MALQNAFGDIALDASVIEVRDAVNALKTTSGGTSDNKMTLVGGQTAGGVLKAFETNASGHLNISDGGGSITVDMAITSTENPSQSVSALPTRQAPQKYWNCGFSKVGSGLQNTDKMTLIQTGGGQTVAQSAGNLTITCGTTANSETIIRSIETFNGALQMLAMVTAGTRNTLNDLFVELVDVIGDGLAFTINSTTSVTVTKVAHGFTSADVGQRMDIGALSLSTCPPQEAVIASIPSVDTITFTVAGFPASGSGTCSLWGYNKYELRYTTATATNAAFNVRRKGWRNTAVTATINTTASGHVAALAVKNGVASLSDKTLAAGNAFTNRTFWDANCPDDDAELYLQIRCRNGTSSPASLVWTIGGVRISDYVPQQVEIVSIEQQSPRTALRTENTNTLTANATLQASTNRAAFIANAGIWYDDSSTVLASNATFTGTSRDLTVTATATAFANAATYAKELRVSAESDQAGTLWLEVSRDNSNWRRIKSVATAAITGGGQYAEIVHRPSWRYARVGYTNGATLQGRFTIGTILMAA